VFRDAIVEVRDEGRTVLLSSHILAEVEALCRRVTIIRNGRTVESGALTDLRQLSHTSVLATLDSAPGVVQELQAVDGVHDVGLDGTTVRFAVESGSLGAALELLGRHGIRTLSSAPPSLEELFVGLYRSQEQSAAVSS
jgi:ABC-2 type transport system ATP-binding protein